MTAAELVNAIQSRVRKRVEFREIISGYNPQVEFDWGSHTFYAVGSRDEQDIRVLHVVEAGVHQSTIHSKYLQGVLNGGIRDDSGKLLEEPA